MTDTEGHTILSTTDDIAFETSYFLLYPMGLAISIVILCILFAHLKTIKHDEENNNKYYVYAIQSSIISVIGGIGFYLGNIFLANNAFISWKYDTKITTSLESMVIPFFIALKVFLYYAFTFVIQSILNKPFSLLFKIWMVIVALLFTALMITAIVADIQSYDAAEVDIDTKRNIQILWDSESSYPALTAIVGLDLLYFIVLTIYYVRSLRDIQKIFKKISPLGIKGLILMPFSTIVFILMMISSEVVSPFRYWTGAIFIFTDNMCLFLVSKRGDDLFQNLCGRCCGNCCEKCVYGNQYDGYEKVFNPNQDEDDEADTDALL